MIHCSNCTFCKNQIDKTIKVEGGIRVIPACKAFPNGIPHKEYNEVDFNTKRECANGFYFTPNDEDKDWIEEREQRKLEQSKQKRETIFDKVKKLIKR